MFINFMNINPLSNNINVVPSPKYKNNAVYQNLVPLPFDTVSFKAIRRTKDLLDLPAKEILSICKDALAKKVEVGRGQEAVVYKIDDYARDYCLRAEHRANIVLDNLKLDYKLNKFDKANFVVAKLGEGVTLLKYISGIPLKVMTNSDTPAGIKVKRTLQELIANNFDESAFIKIIKQVENNRTNGIIFDRKGENILVDPMIQELTAIDFSSRFNDIEYNPISYIYHALDVDKTVYAPKIFGKLCSAYAEYLKDAKIENLNLDVLDKNFYHRGFIDDPFCYYPDREMLHLVQHKLFDELLEAKKHKSPEEFEVMADEFKNFVDEKLINKIASRYSFF